ncbi:uncharacterized protein [Rutidosis leptorrhynchoides]|uniref:uncharacterized protein n=1 Tax=Rutidosis leptorrhynchoides TaxID=125765 RepID=UPI003A9A518F
METFEKLDAKTDDLKATLVKWENIAKERPPLDGERQIWMEAHRKWIENEKIKLCMAKQKLRAKWVMEGDENSSLIWVFLKDMMERMGFGHKWRKWILACLWSASVSVLVNGSPTNEFSLQRGVRQGDPLSYFLFIVASEGLNIITKVAIANGLYKGVKIGSDNVLISHLQCADDTIFLGEWIWKNGLRSFSVIEKRSVPTVAAAESAELEKKVNGFCSSFSQVIGDGSSTFFWTEPWLIETPLKEKFRRLYQLNMDTNATVQEKVEWRDGKFFPKWSWSRVPSGKANGKLAELTNLRCHNQLT